MALDKKKDKGKSEHTGLRLSTAVIEMGDALVPLLEDDVVLYPGGRPTRSDVMRQAMVIGLQEMQKKYGE